MTRTWPTRIDNGIAIQLCGTDSPNYDHPRGKNPHSGIITPEQIESDRKASRNEVLFAMMNLGILPKNPEKKRVITVGMCERNNAFDQVVWGSGTLVRVLGLDAAYSGTGGDRTVLTDLSFGRDVSGEIKIAFTEPQVTIPIKSGAESPEEQIVKFVSEYASERSIPSNHVGFDSTGRGSLASAFGRLWETDVVAIEFGGKASDRVVREGTEQTEYEAYDRMVTSLWYASRLIIESGQLRNLDRECALDGSFRAWRLNGKRTSVEPKEDTIKRQGRSPDLWDSLVTAIEMARRHGFTIKSGGSAFSFRRRPVTTWLIGKTELQRKQSEANCLHAV
jgi:hypothetical protein